jgi:hypothetical protein
MSDIKDLLAAMESDDFAHEVKLPVSKLEIKTRDITAKHRLDTLKSVSADSSKKVERSVDLVKRTLVDQSIDINALPDWDVSFLLAHTRVTAYGPEINMTSECPVCKNPNQLKIDMIVDGVMQAYYSAIAEVEYPMHAECGRISVDVNHPLYGDVKEINKNLESYIASYFADKKAFGDMSKEDIDQVKNVLIMASTISAIKIGEVSMSFDGRPLADKIKVMLSLPNIVVNRISEMNIANISKEISKLVKVNDVTCESCTNKYKVISNLLDKDFFVVWR